MDAPRQVFTAVCDLLCKDEHRDLWGMKHCQIESKVVSKTRETQSVQLHCIPYFLILVSVHVSPVFPGLPMAGAGEGRRKVLLYPRRLRFCGRSLGLLDVAVAMESDDLWQ